jgi:hypothetical protein
VNTSLTSPLHTDRFEAPVQSERLLAAGERERFRLLIGRWIKKNYCYNSIFKGKVKPVRLKWVLTIIAFGISTCVISPVNAATSQNLEKNWLAKIIKNSDKNLINDLVPKNTAEKLINSNLNRRLISLELIILNSKKQKIIIRQLIISSKKVEFPFKIPPEIVESLRGEVSGISRKFSKLYLFGDLAIIPGNQVVIGTYYDIVYSDAVIKFWDYKTGREIRTQYIAFDPNGELIGKMRISSDASTIIWSGTDKGGNIVKVDRYQLKGEQYVQCLVGC